MQHGGVEKVIASLANMFVEFDYNVEILCTYNLGPMAYPLDSAVKITYLTENAQIVMPSKLLSNQKIHSKF